MDNTQDYWQKFDETFFQDGYRLCSTYLADGVTLSQLFAAQKQLYKTIDQLIDTFLARVAAEGNPSECKKGCAYCCHQTVLASTSELLYLADFVRKKYPGKLITKVHQRIVDKAAITANMKTEKLLRFKMPCPLLHPTDGYCVAYQARPVACRIYLSSSVKSCIDDLNSPADDSVFPTLYEMPLRAGRMLNEGFQARLHQIKNNQPQLFESTIELGLLAAFGEGTGTKWLAGKKVFDMLP
jgi:Fe-S-cluster containining protein